MMKKIAPVALALALGSRALFGNPLESTIIKEDTQKELDITGGIDNKSFSLDASLPMPNDWSINFASDVSLADMENPGPPRINNLELVLGRENFYFGASYGDLSTETLLQGSNILKVQWGMKPADWIDFSVTGATVNLPGMSTDITAQRSRKFDTPFKLYAGGLNLNIGKEFALDSFSGLFPWLSTTGSFYFAEPKFTDDYWQLNSITGYDSELMAYPFHHLNIRAGLDFKTKYLDWGYQGTFDGLACFNFTNGIGLTLHDEKKENFNLEYDVSLITKPSSFFDRILAPTRNELQFDLKAFSLFKNGIYLKGQASALIDFLTPNKFNVTAAVGKKFNWGNLELYFSSQSNPETASQNNVLGLKYSAQLDKSTDKESRTRNSFKTSLGVENPNIAGLYDSASTLHSKFGNTLEEAVSKIHSEQDLSNLATYILWQAHKGTFSAREEYEKGFGTCRDTNGNLLPYIEKAAFDYKNVYAVSIRGPFISHVIVVIESKENKFNIRNYDSYYETNAPTAQAAIDKVFPGACIYGDGTTSTSVQTIRDAVERPLWIWNANSDNSETNFISSK